MRRLPVFLATAVLGIAALGVGTTHAHADTGGGSSTTVPAPSAAQIVATARQYLGYPYAYIGDDPTTGFSCIGFAHFVFAQNGVYVPEDLSAAYAGAPAVDQSALQPGDLVFFQNTVWSGISHVDIYIGDGKMIGADSFQTGVQVDTLSDAYWQEHYLGATRPLADPSGTPPNPAATPPAATGPSLAPSHGPSLKIKPGTALALRHAATIYSGPGATYMAIDTVAASTALTAVQAEGQWVNVSYNGGSQYGWVHGPDLRLSAAQSVAATATPAPSATATAGDGSGTGQQPSATATPAPSTTTGRTGAGQTLATLSAVPVYSGPTAADEVLAQLGAGARVTVLRRVGTWDQVVLADGTQGWVRASSLVSPAAHAGRSPATPARRVAGARPSSGAHPPRVQVAGFHAVNGRMVVVVADVLFVRAGPDGHARILRRVHAGDRLRVLTTQRGWDYVALRDDSRGWVKALWVRAAHS